MRVAFLGLGLMGGRMAANLQRKGFEIAVWNRTKAKADTLVQKGARFARSPKDAAAQAEVVCTSLSDPEAMERVFFADDGIQAGLAPGKRMIDFSTLSPALVRRLTAACEAKGAEFVAAPVTGSKLAAEEASLTFVCGGPRRAFEDLEPLMHALGKKTLYVGEAWQAAQAKLVANMFIAHMMEALAEGAALAARSDIALSQILEVVQSSDYASPYWDFKGQALQARDFSRHFSVELMHKDLSLALETGRDLGVPMPGTAAIREVYQFARAQGLGEKDIVATAQVIDPTLAKAR